MNNTSAYSIPDVVVVGAGIFGATGALELASRGHRVTLVDPGPLPHPLASSTDISKLVRPEYGSDVFYTELMERALAGWRALNARWPEPLFHETGILFLTREPMAEGSFEHDSFELLSARGHTLERLDGPGIARRFPEWARGRYADGYVDPHAGWAESGRVVARFVEEARASGVTLREGERTLALLAEGERVVGVRTDRGELRAGTVVLAAGAWTPTLAPWLAPALRVVGQPVLHFRPSDAHLFTPPAFLPFAADVSRTGWYGFALHPSGVVKIASHGPGIPIHPDAARTLPADTEASFRAFLRESIPGLAGAPLAASRMCLYCDSADGDPWIAADPSRPGLVIASGGSGHAFKFAPVLGAIIADAVEARESPSAARFGYRTAGDARFEAARFPGSDVS